MTKLTDSAIEPCAIGQFEQLGYVGGLVVDNRQVNKGKIKTPACIFRRRGESRVEINVVAYAIPRQAGFACGHHEQQVLLKRDKQLGGYIGTNCPRVPALLLKVEAAGVWVEFGYSRSGAVGMTAVTASATGQVIKQVCHGDQGAFLTACTRRAS